MVSEARWSLLGLKLCKYVTLQNTKFIAISPSIQMYSFISSDEIFSCLIFLLCIWHETHKCKVHVCMTRGWKRKSLPGVPQSVFSFANLVPLERWDMGSRNKQKWEAPSEKPSEIQNSSEKGLFVFGYRGGGSWDKL